MTEQEQLVNSKSTSHKPNGSGVVANEDDVKAYENEIKADENVLKDLFYIYYKQTITGPYNHQQIFQLYVADKIKKTIWLKNAQYAQKQGELGKWCQCQISKRKDSDSFDIERSNQGDGKLQDRFPELYHYLIPKIKYMNTHNLIPGDDTCTPTDIPADTKENENLSKLAVIVRILSICVFAVCAVIIGLHLIPTFCVAVVVLCCIFITCDNKLERSRTKFAFIILSTLGLLIVPFIIVYSILLGAVDHSGWNGEIQSWMISYLSWGIFSFLYSTIVALAIVMEVKLTLIMALMFWIIGVDFGDIDPDNFRANLTFALAVVFVYPALAALLPATIIGFIANYVLEEQFELQCSHDITDSELCFDDKYGCCEIISSHNIQDSYQFMGGLSSNILATWAIIRIIGYLMVNVTPEAAIFAKRNDPL